jgi:catechol 2,3-dioxygenase-like lactoylglutathione lyase family enzyme
MKRFPNLGQVNLVVTDMAATLAFYRLLGLEIPDDAGPPHVEVEVKPGVRLEFDSIESVQLWDTGWRGETGGAAVLGFDVEHRSDVDDAFGRLVAAGHRGRQPPYDAFWGSRHAIVEDPDGNPVAIMSLIEEAARYWPPREPPRAAT